MKFLKNIFKKNVSLFKYPEQNGSYWLMFLGISASLSLVACALCYLVAPVPIDGLIGFLPDSGETHQSWFTVVYSAGLVVYALATVPIVAVCAMRCFRLNPVLIMLATVWLELSLVLELINNLPFVSRFLLPPTAVPIGLSDETLNYLSQLNALNYYALDVPGFMLAYVGLAIIAAVVYRRTRSMAIITTTSFVFLLANVPFLWLEPKVLAPIFMGMAILIFAGFPLAMVKLLINSNPNTKEND